MEEKINSIIKKEFDANTIKITKITEGHSHYMYDIEIDKEPFNVILRFSNNSSKYVNLGKEKFIIELLRDNDIQAPKILAHNPSESIKEEYIILEKLSGVRLDKIWDYLKKEERLNIANEVGSLLAKIHSIKMNDFGMIQEGGKIEIDTPFQFKREGEFLPFSKYLRIRLEDSFKDLARLISYYENISIEFFPDALTYVINNLKELDYKGNPILTHGDFIPGHIFVEKINNEYRITGLIDFEFAAAASPEYDFIKLHRAGFFEDSDLKKALLEGYGNTISEKSVEIHRILRDIGFAWVVMERGNKKLAEEVISKVIKMINREAN